MTLEDLAECDAEVIQPISYDFKVGKAGDEGITLWEVSGGTAVFLQLLTSSARQMDKVSLLLLPSVSLKQWKCSTASMCWTWITTPPFTSTSSSRRFVSLSQIVSVKSLLS